MSKIVISLTSYPDRIDTTHLVLESLFRQKKKADEIVLWLSTLEFPNLFEDLPKELRYVFGKNGFRIEWVEGNIKSHKKYFYALQNREDIVITVDDDMYYSNMLVSTLMNSYRKHPHAISARNVHIITQREGRIAPYLKWESDVTEYIDLERTDLCPIGVNGVLYPPGCSKNEWFNKEDIMKYAMNQDDLWLKFNEIVSEIPVVYTGIKEKDVVIEKSQGSVLYIQNVYGGDNDICIKKLCKKLKEKNREIFQKWFDNLLTMEEYLYKKREYYSREMRNILARHVGGKKYIGGAGKYAHVVWEFIRSCNMENYIEAFLVTSNLPKNKDDIEVRLIKELDKQEIFTVICGVSSKYSDELKAELCIYEFHTWIDVDLPGIARLLELERNYK